MKNKIICFHHDDLDGIGSGAIILKRYPKAEMVKCSYGDDFSNIDIKNKIVYLLDFSFDKDIMSKILLECQDFHWCDHHISAKEKYPNLWDSTPGLRSLKKSGIRLTWEYIYPNEDVPMIVKVIEDCDLWKFKYSSSKAIYEYATLVLDEPDSTFYIPLFRFDEGIPLLNTFKKYGEILLQANEKRVKKAFKYGTEINFEGYKTLLINSNNDFSDIGSYCAKNDYDIGMTWYLKKDKIIISLRSIGDINVSKIAKKYGGGGHKRASGFETDLKFIEELLK